MGGIYPRGDTSSLIMPSSFLFPAHSWAVSPRSQFSSTHGTAPSPSPLRENPSSAEEQPPAVPEAPQGVADVKKQQSRAGGRRDKTLNKAVRRLWKKASRKDPVCIRYSESRCQSIVVCIKPRWRSSPLQREVPVVVTVGQLVLSSPFPCSVIYPVLLAAHVPWNICAICNQHTMRLSCNSINHPAASV